MAGESLELWRYLDCQRNLAAQLIEGTSLDDVAEGFLSSIAELLRWEVGALWEREPDASALRYVAGWSAEGFDAEPFWRRSRGLEIRVGRGLPGRAWERGDIVAAPDFARNRAYHRAPAAVELGLTGGIAIPIPIGHPQEVLAVAEFFGSDFQPQPKEVTSLLSGFADQLATFIARRRAEDEIANRESFLAEVVRGTQDAVISKDLRGYVTSWNPAAERLYGYTRDEAVGRHISFIVPEDHKNEEMEIIDRIRRGERLETYETERIRADGKRIVISLTVSPIKSERGRLIGASVIARDITSEVRARRAEAFLVTASRLLDSSLDPEETARTIVATAVPELAEICLIDFLRPDGRLGDSIVAGADPEAASRLERIRNETPLDPRSDHPVAQVLREQMPMTWRDLKAPEVVEQVAQSSDHRQLMEDAGYNSAAVVPLVARGRTLGAISFLHAARDLRYDPDDLAFLSELGDRAAMALDNARLFRERAQIAENLQRGLRPPKPPEIPGLEFSVVFEPAGEGIEVGGDFYDFLPAEGGCWVLIGDVAGKGSAAAGVSVAVRHAVRGLTREIDEPEEVLRRVNELLLDGGTLNDFATAQLLRLSRNGDGWHLSLAAAGHPPAVHTTPKGQEQLGGGSVLGGFTDVEVARHDVAMGAEDTLVLYTDGWLEVGPVSQHRRTDALAESVGSLVELDLDQVTQRLRLDALERGAGDLRDDLVILAVRPCGAR